MSKPVLSGPYFILPASRDAAHLHDQAQAERKIDFSRGYACGAITVLTIVIAAHLAVLWLA
ncbi:hypothetical protein [Rhizobium sp. Leaf386]|uniref:hypothetical protein n=1 Tax=Rhizobium sp. Leaf386 TaxID=1736359 RepID=UPI000714C12A|nr:hypothetical protein [Rhizobium sp. Leaf386]KQS90324.1 hypothetical protein ASG50_07670 [Rhizobium sp. Leaf386]